MSGVALSSEKIGAKRRSNRRSHKVCVLAFANTVRRVLPFCFNVASLLQRTFVTALTQTLAKEPHKKENQTP